MIHVSGTMFVLQAAGLCGSSIDEVEEAQRHLTYLLRWLDEFSEVWPAAAQTAGSIRVLRDQHCFL